MSREDFLNAEPDEDIQEIPKRKRERKIIQVCKVCSHDERYDIESLVVNRVHTQRDVAELYGFSKRQLSIHMNHHFKQAILPFVGKEYGTKMAKVVVNKIGLMKENLMHLNNRLNKMHAGAEISVKDLKSLASEVRAWIMDLARLEGDYKEAPKVYVQKVEKQFVAYNQFMVENLCSKCKDKFINEFPDVIDVEPEVEVE